MKSEEHKIQSEFFQILDWNKNKHPELDYIYAIPNGANHPKRQVFSKKLGRSILISTQGNKLKREGVKEGVLDVCVPITISDSEGKIIQPGLYLEFKTPKGTLRPKQKRYKDFLISQGYRVEVVRSSDEAIKVLEEYLNLKLN